MNTDAGAHKTDMEDADPCGLTTDGSVHEKVELSYGPLTRGCHTKVVKGFTTQQVCQSENFCQVNAEVILN